MTGYIKFIKCDIVKVIPFKNIVQKKEHSGVLKIRKILLNLYFAVYKNVLS
jgi:hypothetical protein